MPLDPANRCSIFVELEAFRTQSDPLIDPDALTDDAGFADHDSRSVVDEETFTNGSPGMDIDAGRAVGRFGDHPRDDRHIDSVKFVRQAVVCDRCDPRVAKDHLVGIGGRGVPFIGGLDIQGEFVLHLREFPKECHRQISGPLVTIRQAGRPFFAGKTDSPLDLLLKSSSDPIESRSDMKTETLFLDFGKSEITRKQDGAEFFDDLPDNLT